MDTFFPENNPNVNKISDSDKESCDGYLTKQECHRALQQMANRKSPGGDGFTAEFYKFFWPDISDILVNSLNESYDKGEMSITQRQGLIQCIPKANKDRRFLGNWRPITLLNVDYKIGSAVIANRLKSILPGIISDTQKGYLKGREAAECSRLNLDIIEEYNKMGKSAIALMLDFLKAFDSVEWSFIDKCLEYFNFGPGLRQWFKVFYRNISSAVLNNGFRSDFFSVERGARQGDPLSPYIFILVVEILSAAVKNSENIKGVTFDDTEIVISQLADDTNLYLDDDDDSLLYSIALIDFFGEGSGLILNKEKTKVFWIGHKAGSFDIKNPELNLHWVAPNDYVTSLGIHYLVDGSDHPK